MLPSSLNTGMTMENNGRGRIILQIKSYRDEPTKYNNNHKNCGTKLNSKKFIL